MVNRNQVLSYRSPSIISELFSSSCGISVEVLGIFEATGAIYRILHNSVTLRCLTRSLYDELPEMIDTSFINGLILDIMYADCYVQNGRISVHENGRTLFPYDLTLDADRIALVGLIRECQITLLSEYNFPNVGDIVSDDPNSDGPQFRIIERGFFTCSLETL